ncbi:MAG TPA: hypothetical protein VF629_18215 [Hymenobacter sp.]
MEFADQSTPGRRFKPTQKNNHPQTTNIKSLLFMMLQMKLIAAVVAEFYLLLAQWTKLFLRATYSRGM